jgi:hypothetical protein
MDSTQLAANGKAQDKILEFAKAILTTRQKQNPLRDKLAAIDEAYARYKTAKSESEKTEAGQMSCGNAFDTDDVVPPIVASQVDSYVAYLADIFLSGYPLFPVVSTPNKRKAAEQLEVLLDDHAMLGGYVRQLLLMIKNGVKYNVCALEIEWSSIEQYTILSDYTNTQSGKKLDKVPKGYNCIKNLDMYNTVWDMTVAPGDVATCGDYAGYIEVISKTKLKRYLTKLAKEEKAVNIKEALASRFSPNSGALTVNYQFPPNISQYIANNAVKGQNTWDSFLGFGVNAATNDPKNVNLYDGSNYEKFTLYARIAPVDLAIPSAGAKTPQIWKFVIINSDVVVSAERIISAYDCLPIIMGQPLEDGLDYQTQSVAEGAMPFQRAASTLFNIRFAASRRAVSDRALYNADLVSPSDVNSPSPAAKIPVRFKALSNATFDQAYRDIPFDMRGTDSTIADARTIVGFSQELSGLNGPQQGQFQKGNKSVSEYNDVMAGSDGRLRLPALLMECQVFTILKQIMALNIFQYGANTQVVSQTTGEIIDIDIDALRKEVLSFRVADGYTPKSKLAGTEILMSGMNMIMNSPMLQQAYGSSLPALFAHIMQLGGARDFDQYTPQQPPAPTSPALTAQSLQAQGGVSTDPATGAAAAAMPAGMTP